jgi:very-short-patch-repair endonuclease
MDFEFEEIIKMKKTLRYSELPKYPKGAIGRARYLRNNMTKHELIVWRYIREKQLGVKFKRQVPINRYIVDFFSLEIGLVIEIDGGHHYDPKITKKDKVRTNDLLNWGLTVIRYNNDEVLTNIEGVINSIGEKVDELKERYEIE